MLTWFKTDLLVRVSVRLRKKYRATKMIFFRVEVRCSGAGSGCCCCASSSRASYSRSSSASEDEDEDEDPDDESRLGFSRLSRDGEVDSDELILRWSGLY
jgi:hypothetical protein